MGHPRSTENGVTRDVRQISSQFHDQEIRKVVEGEASGQEDEGFGRHEHRHLGYGQQTLISDTDPSCLGECSFRHEGPVFCVCELRYSSVTAPEEVVV